MSIPLAELQQRVDDLKRAYLSGTLSIRFSDGKEQRFQSMDSMLKAIQAGEDWIAQTSGSVPSQTTLVETKRGDGPTGPTMVDFPGGW